MFTLFKLFSLTQTKKILLFYNLLAKGGNLRKQTPPVYRIIIFLFGLEKIIIYFYYLLKINYFQDFQNFQYFKIYINTIILIY